MNKLSIIKHQLRLINDTVFQELCDSFLSLRHKDYKLFVRKGGHDTKQKTTIGTPDSFFLLPNGNYLFVEATTIEHKGNQLIKKLKADLVSCLNENKTKIKKNKIQEIILCYNSNIVDLDIIEEINQPILDATGRLPIHYNLERLANEIFFHHKNLAYEYLGVELDTGQIVSLEKFILDYDNGKQKLSTPLGNPFYLRNEELIEFQKRIQNDDIIILYGSAGIGKSKLALKGIQDFLSNNINYNAYAISPKGADLLGDLSTYFKGSEKNILLVDDVNRVDKFQQILGFYQNLELSNLKLILTVRDYALENIKFKLSRYKSTFLKIKPFKREEIISIIKEKPFEILHSSYQYKITSIVNGNVRLAIMMAQIAKKKGSLDSLNNVTDIFEEFFETFVSDEGAFKDKKVLKTIGILSFFYTIPYNDSNVIQSINSILRLSAEDLNQSLDRLHELDFVQLRYDHARIAEQNLSTYFFYKVFIKDQLLSFEELVLNYFEKKENNQERRFSDTVIPSSTNFDRETVIKVVKPALLNYYATIEGNKGKEYNFFKFSWSFIPDTALEYIKNAIEKHPIIKSSNYQTDYDHNKIVSKLDAFLILISNYYQDEEYIEDALHLSFEYILRFPDLLPHYIFQIHENLRFDDSDYFNHFKRHKLLVQFLTSKIEEGEIYAKTFFAISAELLDYMRWSFKESSENKNDDPNISAIKAIRGKVLESICHWFKHYPNEVLLILIKFSTGINRGNQYTFNFDFNYLIPLINAQFNKEDFKHCFYVNEMIRSAKRKEIKHENFYRLQKEFEHIIYSDFQTLNRDRRRMKEDYEYRIEMKFEALKDLDISKRFLFNNKTEVDSFLQRYEEILSWKEIRLHSQNKCIELIIIENLKVNEKIGFYTFVEFAKFCIRVKSSSNLYFTNITIEALTISPKLTEKLWNLIDNECLGNLWRWDILLSIPEEQIQQNHLDRLYNTFNNQKEGFYLIHKRLTRFEKLDSKILEKVFKQAVYKNEKEKIEIRMFEDYFEETCDKLDLKSLKTAYLQQAEISNHFDHQGKALLSILRRDQEFLFEYLKVLFESDKTEEAKDHKEFHVVWELSNVQELMDKAFIFMAEYKGYFSLGEHFATVFFKKTQLNERELKEYLINQVNKKYNDPPLMSIIFNVIHYSVRELYDEAFALYITKNQEIESFKKIKWWRDQTMYSGGANVGEITAAKWQKLLEHIESLNINFKTREIRGYIKSQIDNQLERANKERMRSFLNGF